MLLLLLSKSQPLTLGCDLVLGATLEAAASILVWVPPPKGGFTLRRLQCSAEVNSACAKGLPEVNRLYGAFAPRPRRADFCK